MSQGNKKTQGKVWGGGARQKRAQKEKEKEVCSVGGIASKDDSGILKNKTWRQQEKKKQVLWGG